MDGEPITKINTENSNNGSGMGLEPGIKIEKKIEALPKEAQEKILEVGMNAEKAKQVVEEAKKKEVDVNQLSDEEYYKLYGMGY